MDSSLAHDVYIQALKHGANARVMSPVETQEVVRKIETLYVSPDGASGRPLWERFRVARSRHDPDAWKDISGLIGESGVVMVIADFHRYSAVSISNGLVVSAALTETVSFVFYLTDDNVDYVLCFNDHDVLIGTGRASGWIELHAR